MIFRRVQRRLCVPGARPRRPISAPLSYLRRRVPCANERPVGRVIIPLARCAARLRAAHAVGAAPPAPGVCFWCARSTRRRRTRASTRRRRASPARSVVRPSRRLGVSRSSIQLKLDVLHAPRGRDARRVRARAALEIEREASADDATAGGEAEPATRSESYFHEMCVMFRYAEMARRTRGTLSVWKRRSSSPPTGCAPRRGRRRQGRQRRLAATNGAFIAARRGVLGHGVLLVQVGESDMRRRDSRSSRWSRVAPRSCRAGRVRRLPCSRASRNKNTLNFEDGSVTAVAFALLSLLAAACSAVLYARAAAGDRLRRRHPAPSSPRWRRRRAAAAPASGGRRRRRPTTRRPRRPRRRRRGGAPTSKAKPGLAQMVKNVLSRAPDLSDLAHRHMAI